MTTDTSEKGLERLICEAMTGAACDPPQSGTVYERTAGYGTGWICGDPQDYDREHCVDLAQLSAFLHDTQSKAAESLDLDDRTAPLGAISWLRLQREITKRGTIDVLRKGIKHGPHQIDLMYGTPSPGNEKARVLYGQNHFSVTRQLRYSNDNAQLAIDLCLFINGLPVATFELKNSLTKQTVDDGVEQYKRDRNPRERLFELGQVPRPFRCGRPRGAVLHASQGQGVMVPALQQGMGRRCGQPAESQRPQDRLPVEAGAHPGRSHQHH